MKHSIHSLTLTQGPRKKRLYLSTLSLCLYAFALTLMTVSRQPSHYRHSTTVVFSFESLGSICQEKILVCYFSWLYKWSGMLPLSKSSQPEILVSTRHKLPSGISNIRRKTPGGQTTLTTQPSGPACFQYELTTKNWLNWCKLNKLRTILHRTL